MLIFPISACFFALVHLTYIHLAQARKGGLMSMLKKNCNFLQKKTKKGIDKGKKGLYK